MPNIERVAGQYPAGCTHMLHRLYLYLKVDCLSNVAMESGINCFGMQSFFLPFGAMLLLRETIRQNEIMQW